MIEKELLNMFIEERIICYLIISSKQNPKKSPKEQERILQAERLINSFTDKERELVQNYIQNYTGLFATDKPLFYQQGWFGEIIYLSPLI